MLPSFIFDMIAKEQKDFFIYQLVLLCMLVYGFLFPLIVPYMRELFPDFWHCTYQAHFHKPCPFCGTTTYFYRLLVYGEALPGYLMLASGIALFEFFRKAVLCFVLGRGKRVPILLCVVDVVCTVVGIIAVVCCFLLR